MLILVWLKKRTTWTELYEWHTCEHAGGDKAGPVAGLGALCDHGFLDVIDFVPVFGGRPGAEVWGERVRGGQ